MLSESLSVAINAIAYFVGGDTVSFLIEEDSFPSPFSGFVSQVANGLATGTPVSKHEAAVSAGVNDFAVHSLGVGLLAVVARGFGG
jgi:hypothetical protein